MFSFKPKKKEVVEPKFNQDLEIISQMNQEFALSLDLNETLQTALKVIIQRINAKAANVFLIDMMQGITSCITYFESVVRLTIQGSFKAFNPSIAALSSI